MSNIDLQTHSTCSDGRLAPDAVVRLAKKSNVSVISLTDHDSVAGVEEATRIGKELGITVIPGIELSIQEHGAHLLGYGIDIQHPHLVEKLKKFIHEREERAKKMIENLRGAGFAVTWEDVMREARGATITRPHIARAVVNRVENKERLGSVSSVYEFLNEYISDESPFYVAGEHISGKEAIRLIHEIGGVAALSHPTIPDFMQGQYDELEKFVQELMGWGFDGIEVFNSSMSEDDTEFLEGITVKYHLLRSAGSDFHEEGEHPRDEAGRHAARTVGDYDTFGFSIEGIVEKLDEAIAAHKPGRDVEGTKTS